MTNKVKVLLSNPFDYSTTGVSIVLFVSFIIISTLSGS